MYVLIIDDTIEHEQTITLDLFTSLKKAQNRFNMTYLIVRQLTLKIFIVLMMMGFLMKITCK